MGSSELFEGGCFLDQGGDGDDGQVFSSKGAPFLPAIENVVILVSLWVESCWVIEMVWILLGRILFVG